MKLSNDYDTEGNLIEAISPAVSGTLTGNDFPNGKKETYTYSKGFPDNRLNHNLLSVTHPNENDANHGLPPDETPAKEWTYNLDDRVVSHTIGVSSVDGEAGGTLIYEYDDNPPPPPDFDSTMEDPAVRKVSETDRNGNIRVYWIDDFGTLTRYEHFTRGIRAGEPTKYLKRYKLNDDNVNTNVCNPEGDQWNMTFDSSNPDPRQRGNLLRAVHVPGSRGGDQAQIESAYVYDPFYNQPCLVVDPRAFDPAFTPPNGGTASPQRYASFYIFDYQEGPNDITHKARLADKFGLSLAEINDIISYNENQVELLLGLASGTYSLLGHGDVNGDGRTDQIDGNHVMLIEPDVNLEPDSNQALGTGSASQVIENVMAWDDHGLKLYDIDPVGNVTDYLYFPATDPNGDGETSEVTDPRSGNGYLSTLIQDGRELSGVIPRQATAEGIPFANLQTAYDRDPAGNIIAMTDPRGNTWTYTVNELNQVIRTVEPDPYSYFTDTIYDANNNVVERRNRKHGSGACR